MKVEFYLLGVVSFLILGCTCNPEHSSLDDTSPDVFPFHALVRGRYTCNGILISEDYIITPASCVYGSDAVTVFLGFRGYPYFLANHQEPNVQIYKCKNIIIHDDYAKINNQRYLNNIALIKLSSPAKLSETVHPGKLITAEESQLYIGKYVDITGWILSINSNLKKVSVQLRNQDTCNYLFGDIFFRSQEICVKWLKSFHLNLLGNPVSTNGRIIGFQTNTPDCAVQSSSCSRNDMILNIVPFLDWISRETQIQTSKFTEPDKQNNQLIEEVKTLQTYINGVKEQNTLFGERLENITNHIQEIQKRDINYALNLNEQTNAVRSEISNSETRQNTSILKLQEEMGGTRTEITNGLAAQKADNDNLAKRLAALDTRIQQDDDQLQQLKNTLERIKNQTEMNLFKINELVTSTQKESLNIKTTLSVQEKTLRTLVQENHDKLWHSLQNITSLQDHRAQVVDGIIKNIYDKINQHKLNEAENYEKLNKALLKVSIASETESRKVCDRVDLIEHILDETSATLSKQIIAENEHTAAILKEQKRQGLSLINCCSEWDQDSDPPTQ